MKRKVSELPDTLIQDLETEGLTYKQMIEKYGLTRWGARKLSNQPCVNSEEAGNEKIFSIDKPSDQLLSTSLPVHENPVNHEEEIRQTQKAKQTVTKEANTYLTQLEQEVKNTDVPAPEFNEPDYSGGVTPIIHETDPHFSAHVRNRRGETTYDTETAKQATHEAFHWYREQIIDRCEPEQVEEVVLLLGGDLVEGENIYEGQAHKVDDTLETQIETARKTYFEEIKQLRQVFEIPVKVVCISGNHGDLPVSSSSNADDLVYSMLEDMISISDTGGVRFIRSDRTDGVTFNFRGWKGYLCHGENRSNHIGTSSPQSDWYAMKDQYGFDAAWRGHYHEQKQEDVGGAPVYMTASRKPGDDYTDKIAAFGKTGNAIYFSTDDEPVAGVRKETDVL